MSSSVPDDERSEGRTSRAGQSSGTIVAASRNTTQAPRRGSQQGRRGGRARRTERPPSNPTPPDHQPTGRQSAASRQRSDHSIPDSAHSEELRLLQAQVAELTAQLQEATAANEQPLFRSVESGPAHGPPRDPTSPVSTSPDHRRYAIKLPNPTPFTDGISPTFEQWEVQVRNKLQVNHWQFPDEQTKVAWLISLISGTAAETLSPYTDPCHPSPYTTVAEILTLLRVSYSNPEREGIAKDQFTSLRMTTTDEFFTFCAKFVQLASTAKVPISEWKYELNKRLTKGLRLAALRDYLTPSVNFEQFRALCSAVYQQLSEVEREQARQRQLRPTSVIPNRIPSDQTQRHDVELEKRANSFISVPTRQVPTPQVSRATPARTPEPTSKATPQTNDQSCYACGRDGHFAKHCPTKPPSGTVHFLDQEEELPPSSESDSEKDTA